MTKFHIDDPQVGHVDTGSPEDWKHETQQWVFILSYSWKHYDIAL